jgi:hypothetical protein
MCGDASAIALSQRRSATISQAMNAHESRDLDYVLVKLAS